MQRGAQIQLLAHILEEKLHQGKKHSKIWLSKKNVFGRLGHSHTNFPKQQVNKDTTYSICFVS